MGDEFQHWLDTPCSHCIYHQGNGLPYEILEQGLLTHETVNKCLKSVPSGVFESPFLLKCSLFKDSLGVDDKEERKRRTKEIIKTIN
jgi:hypothetical protein